MVSTVSVVEVRVELPAVSVAIAVTTSAPWPAGVTDVVQCPVPSTVTAAPLTVSVEPISAVPLIWIPPAASAALMILSPPSIVVIATAGAMVSTVSVVEVLDELPAVSVAIAVTTSAPWPAGVTDVVQCPVPSTVTAAPLTVSVEPISRGAADLDAAGGFRRIDDIVATLDGGDRHRRRNGVDRQRRRGARRVARRIGRNRRHHQRALARRRHRRGPVPGAVHRHRRAVDRQRRADLRGAADLDAAGGFRRVDDIVATLDRGDRDRRRRGIERKAERGRAGVAEAVGLAAPQWCAAHRPARPA